MRWDGRIPEVEQQLGLGEVLHFVAEQLVDGGSLVAARLEALIDAAKSMTSK